MRRFGVSIASAVRWMEEYLRTGRTAPKPRGGDRRSGRIEAQAELLMQAPRRCSAWPLEDDHAGRGPAPRRPHHADGHRRRDDGRRLTAYAETFLAPTLAQGDIVILDNLPAHKVSGARAAIERAGARLMFLHRIPRTSIRSSRPSPRSRCSSARPPPGRCTRWKPLSRPHSTPSFRRNAPTTSPTDMSQIDPKML
jgi:hypothetical protein